MKLLARLPLSLRERLWRLCPRLTQDMASVARLLPVFAHLPRTNFVIIGAPGNSAHRGCHGRSHSIRTSSWCPTRLSISPITSDLPLDWYLAHFASALAGSPRHSPPVLGEKSARYCAIEPDRIRMLHRLVPDAKIILMTRDPVKRRWSHVKRFFSKRGIDPSPGRYRRCSTRGAARFPRRTRPLGEFSAIVERWTSVFPSRQFLIVSQEGKLAIRGGL